MRNIVTLRTNETCVDYASPSVSLTHLKAAGHKAVVRYIDGSLRTGKPSWKVVTRTERDRIIAAGLGLMLVFERSANRPLGGALAGHEDGLAARADAAVLGYPATEVILVAVDIDVTTGNQSAVLAYCDAFRAAVGHPVGVYGDRDIIDLLDTKRPGLWSVYWQANAAWWSRIWVIGRWIYPTHAKAHVKQGKQTTTLAGTFDPNVILRPVSFWRGPVPAPPPVDFAHGRFGLWPLNRSKPVLHAGDTGDAVRYLQAVISLKAGGDCPQTGTMDARTVKRVKDLQRFFGITEDGIVGWDRQPNGTVGKQATWPVIDMLAGKQ